MRIIRLAVIGAVAGWLWNKRKQDQAGSPAQVVPHEPLKVWESEGGSVTAPAAAEAPHSVAYH